MNLTWLNSTAISQSDIARRMDMSPALFANKRKNVQYKRFSPQELERLEEVRKQVVAELMG